MQLSLLDFQPDLIGKLPAHLRYKTAAQLVVALVFAEEFDIAIEDLKQERLKITRPLSKIFHPQVYDHLALISFAAIAGLSIIRVGRVQLRKDMLSYADDPIPLQHVETKVQYDTFRKYVKPVARHFILDQVETQWSIINTCLSFLSTESVWEMVESLTKALEEQHTNTFSKQELLKIMMALETYEGFTTEKKEWLSKRYPLTKQKLRF